jgi:oligopeptide transport system permease protein
MNYVYALCASYLILLIGATLFVWFFFPESDWHTDVQEAMQAPSSHHLFGTDNLGRDLLLRTINGARVTLLVGALCSFFSAIIGVTYGSVSAWFGKIWDQILMRLMEVFSSLPQMVTVGLVVIFLTRRDGRTDEVGDFLKLIFAISLGSWMSFARLTRNLVLREKSLLYVEAAVAIGTKPHRILTHQIFPNLLPSLLVMFGLQIPNFLLFESFLSFLGLGVQPPMSSWGILIQEGWKSMLVFPYILIFPSLILFLTVFSLNVVFERFRNNLQKPFTPIEIHH